jgi:tetratricopeptide (TPR) repeat protein
VRIGANTGEVVVRPIRTSDARTEYTPISHTTNLASRIQTLAPTGSIAVTEATQRLCEGYFTFRALGLTRVKGVSEPVTVHEVTGVGALRTRLQRAAGRGFSKFVGREREIARMHRALELAREGCGQIVAAIGEAGLGKSRLLHEFKATVQNDCLLVETFSVSHGKASSYLPVIELLNNYFEIEAGDEARKRREKIAGKILTLDRELENTLPYLYALLGVEETIGALAYMDPQVRQQRTLEAITRIVLWESRNQPLIIVFEDLHWIDTETQALLDLLADAIANVPVLLLVNYRPEYRHGWGNKAHYVELPLDPLGRQSAEEMLSALVGDDIALQPLKRLIIEKTQGNPFFMEETVQILLDEGALIRNGSVKLTKTLGELRIPPTVQAILASRIDRLPAQEKELIQTLAVIGKRFALSLVRKVMNNWAYDLDRMLSDLRLAGFIYELPILPDLEYSFQHSLTLEIAYGSILKERRRLLHERVAASIETLYADRLDEHLAELADHYGNSSNLPKAVEYLVRAGVKAARQSAHSQAVGYLTKGLELLKQMPDCADRDRRELDLQMALAASLSATRSPAAPECEPVRFRARELSERLGDKARLMEALVGLAFFHTVRREFLTARELVEPVIALAKDDGVTGVLVEAHSQMGLVLCAIGQLSAAREHLESALELLARGFYRPLSVLAPGFLSYVLLPLGYPATALTKCREQQLAARQISAPFLIAFALFMEAHIQLELRDSRAVMEKTEDLLSVANEHGISFYLPAVSVFRGWALAASGRGEEAIAEMRRGMSSGIDSFTVLTPLFAGLAEVCGRNGHAEEGLNAIAEGLALVERTGEKNAEAELYRVKGELLLMHNPRYDEEAEHCFRTAIDIAQGQQARLWELRATCSLARLIGHQGKSSEARQILSEIYGWFTEGFDIRDLREAKELLDELNGTDGGMRR